MASVVLPLSVRTPVAESYKAVMPGTGTARYSRSAAVASASVMVTELRLLFSGSVTVMPLPMATPSWSMMPL